MARPTDAEIIKAGYTPEQYDRRNKLWHTMLRELPPDERERINADPGSMDGLILATRVDMLCKQQENPDGPKVS